MVIFFKALVKRSYILGLESTKKEK